MLQAEKAGNATKQMLRPESFYHEGYGGCNAKTSNLKYRVPMLSPCLI
ncbi:hypothetical protein [[Phormidium] sp. ETS-05]|nr:hypothetical protein [[Phormidium] sp. ETS-05]